MSVRERFEWVARVAARRPVVVLGVVLALAVGGGVLALGLKPSTGIDTFVGSSSPSYKATVDDQRHFGSDAVVIMIREPLTKLVLSKDLGTLSFLEGCLAGQPVVQNLQVGAYTPAPAGQANLIGGSSSPCGRLMKAKPVQAVYGPGTFLNQAVTAVNEEISALEAGDQQGIQSAGQAAYEVAIGEHRSQKQAIAAATAAEQLQEQQDLQQAEQLALNSGLNLSQPPSIDNSNFITQVVFDATRGANQPKARFDYLFPSANSALIQVRLKSSLSDSQQAQAISWIRQAVKMPAFRLAYGGTYTVTGAPVVLNDLASQITGSIGGLLIAALLVMGATLLIVFRSRLRLLPLAIALAAAGITFGALPLVGASLTMASIAVLPIMIGLAVDYAVQFQSRVQETRREEAGRALRTDEAIAQAAGRGAPSIAIAALATATGFLVLLLSPVPMVRGFGLLLVVGIAISLATALTAAPAALALADRDGGRLGAELRGATELITASARGAGKLVSAGAGAMPFGRRSREAQARPKGMRRSRVPAALGAITRKPGTVLAIAGLLAIGGWVADTQTSVQSDVTKLVPSTMPALRNLNTLEKVTGVSGEIDVTVRSSNVTKLQTVNWMTNYEQSLLAHYGYLETKGCAAATLCPALSLPDLFSSGTQGNGSSSAASQSQSGIDSLLGAVPQ